MKRLVTLLILSTLSFTLYFCGKGNVTVIELPLQESKTTLSGIDGKLFNLEALVLNSLGETLSAVHKGSPLELSNNIVNDANSVLNTGASPNQILAKNGFAFVLNSLSNNLQIINLSVPNTYTEISTGSGSNPYYMTFYKTDTLDRIYITNLLGGNDNNGNVLVIDSNDSGFTPLTEISLPGGNDLEPYDAPTKAGPQGICVSNSKIYVTLTNMAGWFAGGPGFVVVIDPNTNEIIKKIKTGGLNPTLSYSSPFDKDHVYIMNTGTYTGDGIIDVINSKTDTVVETISIGGAPSIMTLTENKRAFITDALGAHLLSFDANTFEILNDASNPIPVADPAGYNFLSYLDVSSSGNLFILAFGSDEMYIMNPQTLNIVEGPYTVGDGPIGLVLDK